MQDSGEIGERFDERPQRVAAHKDLVHPAFPRQAPGHPVPVHSTDGSAGTGTSPAAAPRVCISFEWAQSQSPKFPDEPKIRDALQVALHESHAKKWRRQR